MTIILTSWLESDIEAWGKLEDSKDLDIQWHVPSKEEIEFAVKVFCTLTEGAVETLSSLTSDNSGIKRDGTGKEWSDEVSKNLVLIRLAISGSSALFDPRYLPHGSLAERQPEMKEDDGDVDMISSPDESDSDPDVESESSTDEEPKTTHRYPTGYAFKDQDDPLYISIHQLRDRIGETLHQVHTFLSSKQEDDVACFNALYTAYRAWFIDVGIERTAHIVDRVTRIFAADAQSFKVSGLRKYYPRPLLLRRSNLYHLQRLRHNTGPRPQSNLDKQLLLDLAASCVSVYTDIRRHAQIASESATKVIIGARPLVIPPLLEAFEESLKVDDYKRMKGAMFSLLYGSLSKTAGKDWRFAPSLIRCFIAASTADKPSIQKLASGALYHIMDFGRPLASLVIVDTAVVLSIAPIEDLKELITQKMDKIQKKKDMVERKKVNLALELVELAKKSHWKTASRAVTIIINLGLRFSTIAPESLLELATLGTIDTHPGLRGLYSGAMVAVSRIFMSCFYDPAADNPLAILSH